MKVIRYLSLVSLLMVVVVISGCQTMHEPKPVSFTTSRGDIEKGASMTEVMVVLGNPRDIRIIPENNSEIWYYDLIEETTLVYFLNKEVIKVVRNEDAFATSSGDVKRDASKKEVEEMLGEPYQRNFSDNYDTWCYRLDGGVSLFVFFKDDRVTSVWRKSASGN